MMIRGRIMEKKPTFSVIIPTHNGATHGWLWKCINSVKSQTFTDYELIIVADSCEDDTAEQAKKYADKLIVTDTHNDGFARNAGLDAAEGEWVLFLDDDDWWIHRWVLEGIFCHLDDYFDILQFAFMWGGEGGAGYTLLQPSGILYPNVWSKCYRRSFVGDTRVSELIKYGADAEFNRLLWQRGPRVSIWDSPLYFYNYLRSGSNTELLKEGKL